MSSQEHWVELIPAYQVTICWRKKKEYLWILGRNGVAWLQTM